MRKIKDLKVGETVVIWSDDRRHEPVENIVHKVGRTKLHTKHPIYPQVRQFNIETACGEYGYNVFPGNMEEYLIFAEDKELTRKFRQEFSSMYSLHLTKDQIDRIKNILNEE